MVIVASGFFLGSLTLSFSAPHRISGISSRRGSAGKRVGGDGGCLGRGSGVYFLSRHLPTVLALMVVASPSPGLHICPLASSRTPRLSHFRSLIGGN